MSDRTLWLYISLAPLISVIIGIVLLCINKWKKTVCTETADGIVIDNKLLDDTFAPIVEYSVNNVRYEKQGPTASSPPEFEVGQKVTVYYRPKDPNTFYIFEEKGGNALALIVIFLGLFVSALFAAFRFLFIPA